MFYRMDGSDYLFVDWDRLDACNKPDDKDARGRRCGARATSYKSTTKGLDKMKKGPKYSGADVKATQKALERRKRQKGQDFTNTREARRIGKLAEQEQGLKSEHNFYQRQKAGGGLKKGTYAVPRGASLNDFEATTRIANQVDRDIAKREKEIAKRKKSGLSVVEGGGKGSDEKVDPRMAKANREIRKLTMQMPATMANTDKALAALKETAERTKKRRERSKARKPRRK